MNTLNGSQAGQEVEVGSTLNFERCDSTASV